MFLFALVALLGIGGAGLAVEYFEDEKKAPTTPNANGSTTTAAASPDSGSSTTSAIDEAGQLIDKATTSIVGSIIPGAGAILGFADNAISSVLPAPLASIATDLIDPGKLLADQAKIAVAIGQTIGAAASDIAGAAAGAASAVGSAVAGAASDVGSAVGSAASAIVSAPGAVLGAIVDVFSGGVSAAQAEQIAETTFTAAHPAGIVDNGDGTVTNNATGKTTQKAAPPSTPAPPRGNPNTRIVTKN